VAQHASSDGLAVFLGEGIEQIILGSDAIQFSKFLYVCGNQFDTSVSFGAARALVEFSVPVGTIAGHHPDRSAPCHYSVVLF
jgi:hypothetical protein